MFYVFVAILKVIWIVAMRTTASQAQSGSLAHEVAHRAAQSFPLAAAAAIGLCVLSGLSFRFLALSRSWRIAAIVTSLLVSLSQIANSARDTLLVTPAYLDLGPQAYSALAVALGMYWGLAVAFSLCSYLLWKQFRASTFVRANRG
jgi:hypothetical protein